PLVVQLDEPAPQPVYLVLDEGRRLAVALARAGDPFEHHRLTPDDRDRTPSAEAPELGAMDRGRHDGHPLLLCNHGRAGKRLAWDSGSLARSLDEEPERVALANDLPHEPHGLAVRFAAAHRNCAERPDDLTESAHPV